MAFTFVTVAPWPAESELVTAGKVASPAWQMWLSKLRLALNGVNAIMPSGKGSPEGVVTAPVGTAYLRSDGGAGTTFYVKESGTGNTGWIGK